MIIEDDERIRETLKVAADSILGLWQAVDAAVYKFVSDCRTERKERRRVIAQQHGKGERFSQLVLLYRFSRGNIDLSWSRIWYFRGSSTPRYKRIPCSGGAVHLARLKSQAHAEEIVLILRHEAQARAYRDLNRRVRALLHDIDHLKDRFEVLVGNGGVLQRKDDESR